MSRNPGRIRPTCHEAYGHLLEMTAACLMTRREQVVGAGGASRDRTDDLRVANATLSQLSYGPVLNIGLVFDDERLAAWPLAHSTLRPRGYGGSGRS